MRIAIDARLNAYRHGGISQYTRQLITALAEVSQADEFISLQHRDQLRPLAIAPNVIRRTALTPPHHRFEQWTLPLEVLLARPSVLHCPDFIAPLRRPCPAVVTIHDLAFMHYPEILDEAASAYYGQVKANAPRAEAIIAVSEATRQDIAQFLDIPIEQIDVIYEAAAPLYTQLELRVGEARVLNGIPVEADTFMLFVSTLEPRKNLPTLLQALRICLDRKPEAGYRLVVVGRRGWRDEAIFNAVRDLKLGEHVLFAGGVGQYDLRWLYNACRMYINPSLYEGFGLPLLEAMACGAACLAAATSSLPEIGGDAAIYVPPLDAEVWADEIEALWDDQERRAELGRVGMARAQRFSWLRAARETLKVYQRAADRIVPTPTPRPLPLGEELADLAADQLPGAAIERRLAPSPGGPRICLRCGTEMSPGKLQHQLGMLPAGENTPDQAFSPRMWACATCGHVELVVDWAVAMRAEPPAPAAEPGEPVEQPPEYVRAADAEAAVNGHPSDQDTFEQVIASADNDSVDRAASPEPALADLAPIADVPTPAAEDPAPSEPAVEAHADRPAEDGAPEQAGDPGAPAEAANPIAEVAVGGEATPPAESRQMEGPPDDQTTGQSNGITTTQRKPRGSRRAQPAAPEAPEAAPAKRRQSRSKRK
jgi:glycosyltransferase involved in cell wall biosynthesis